MLPFCFSKLDLVFHLLLISVLPPLLLTNADDELVEMSADAFGLGTALNEDSSGEVEKSDLTDAVGEELRSRTADNKTQLFPYDQTSYTSSSDITLEQFIDIDLKNTETTKNLSELILEFQLYKHVNLTADQLLDQYDGAMKNLLRVAPKLHVLHPIGGHFFFPDKKTRDQLEFELKFVRGGLDTLTLLMQQHNLSLADDKFDYLKYTLYLVFNEQTINDTDYYQLLKQVFGWAPMQLVNQNLPAHSVSLLFDLNNINIKLDILKFEDSDAVASKGLKQNTRLNYKVVVRPLLELEQTEATSSVEKQLLELLS